MKKFIMIFTLVVLCACFPKLAYADTVTSVGMADLVENNTQIGSVNNILEGVKKSNTVTTAANGVVPGDITNLTVSSTGVTEVDLTWSAVSGASRYKIYRSMSAAGPFKYVGTNKTTAYSNKGLKASTTYYYYVSAVNTSGEGPKSSVVTATTKGNLPTIVTGLKVSSTKVNAIDMTWKAVNGAISYNIYRSVSNAGNFTLLGKSTSANYSDEGLAENTRYYYKVRAVNDYGEGKLSGPVSFTIQVKALNYTAFGDSIAYGLSASKGKGYVDLFNNYLRKQSGNSKMKLDNVAVSGYTSSDLLKQLQDSAVQKTITQSKVVTISIGSNNLLRPTVAALANAFGLNPQDSNFTKDLNDKLSDPANIAILMNLMKPENLPKSLTAGVTQFGTDWSSIIGTIRTLAPNAQIYVTTLYNPLSKDNLVFGLFDQYIQATNEIIKNSNNQYKVADLYPIFLNNTGDPVTGMSLLNPHPTDKGHNLICQTLVKLGL